MTRDNGLFQEVKILEAMPMVRKQDLGTLLWKKLFMETPSGNFRAKQSLGMSSIT